MTAAGSQTFTWNARNQLTATSGGSASFVYDGMGRRIKKVISGATTKFLYDGLNPVQEQTLPLNLSWIQQTGASNDVPLVAFP